MVIQAHVHDNGEGEGNTLSPTLITVPQIQTSSGDLKLSPTGDIDADSNKIKNCREIKSDDNLNLQSAASGAHLIFSPNGQTTRVIRDF